MSKPMSVARRKQLLGVGEEVMRKCINNGDPVKDHFDEVDLLFEFVAAYLEDHGK